jgi:hypothetical protein
VFNKSDYQSKLHLYHTQSRDNIKDISLNSCSINSNVVYLFHLIPTAELIQEIQRNLLSILANNTTATAITETWKYCGRISVYGRNLIQNLFFLITSTHYLCVFLLSPAKRWFGLRPTAVEFASWESLSFQCNVIMWWDVIASKLNQKEYA